MCVRRTAQFCVKYIAFCEAKHTSRARLRSDNGGAKSDDLPAEN